MNPVLVTFDALYARLPEQERRLAGGRADRPAPAWRRLTAVIGATLGRLAALVPDSRDGLRSPEHELAARGIRWASDPAADRALAEELRAASAARHARLAPVVPLPSIEQADLPKAA